MKYRNFIVATIVAGMFAACGQGNQNHEGDHDHHAGEDAEQVEHHDNDGHDHDMDGGGEASSDARVFFENLNDGDIVTSPVLVKMGVEGMNIQPAGEVNEGTGHHHILINKTHIETGEVIPADEQHIHFGKGQTEAEIELEPGEYVLSLQFADGLHQSYGEPMSATIKITVE